MISFNSIEKSIKDIPDEWIYEHYLGIESLNGQDVKIKSIFNDSDSKPSMYIYYKNGYKWKDFSSGKSGNAIQLVMDMFSEDFQTASNRILSDFDGKPVSRNITPQERYTVTNIVEREWLQHDIEYWGQYHISLDILKHFKVKPLKSFDMSISSNVFTVERKYLYGYYNNDGLYKLYQPFIKDRKFMKINSYLQGSEQTKGSRKLILTKSLKDLMCLYQIFDDIDFISVESENTFISPEAIDNLKSKYDNILVVFDNDKAGIESMERYKREFGLDYYIYPFAKDIADSVKLLSFETTRIFLSKYINQIFDK